MTQKPSLDLTQLLIAARDGSGDAIEELFPLVQHELKRLARIQMANERAGHTLQPTILVLMRSIKESQVCC